MFSPVKWIRDKYTTNGLLKGQITAEMELFFCKKLRKPLWPFVKSIPSKIDYTCPVELECVPK